MVILQITANVTDPKDVAIVSTSWPAGNNIGKRAFKSNNIFVSFPQMFWFVYEFYLRCLHFYFLCEVLL